MNKILLFIVGLAMASMACSLSGGADPTVAPTAISFQQNNPTATNTFVIVTSTPQNTEAPTATSFNNSNNDSGNTTRCFVNRPSGWIGYNVQRGDTLGQLSRATGTDVNTLTNVNCLTNPNSLSVGQLLYLPRSPISPTQTSLPTPTPGGAVVKGAVTFSNVDVETGDLVWLFPDETITLAYPQAATNAEKVSFFLGAPGGNTAGLLGTDSNLGDGATLNWLVPTVLNEHTVFAYTYDNTGKVIEQSNLKRVKTTVIENGVITFSHIIRDVDGSIFLQPDVTIGVTYDPQTTATIERIEFNLYNPNTDGWNSIAVDTDGSNGWGLNWTIPHGLDNHNFFVSVYANGTQLQTQVVTGLNSIEYPENDFGTVVPIPLIASTETTIQVAGNSSIELWWPEVPPNASSVSFYFTATGSESAVLLGTDTEIRDGATLDYTTPATFEGVVTAVATVGESATLSSNGITMFAE